MGIRYVEFCSFFDVLEKKNGEESSRNDGDRLADVLGNEAEVGQGIKASGIPREELWVTSKLFELHHHPEHVPLAIKDTLKNLGLEYLDLYLLHWNVSIWVFSRRSEL